MYFSTFNHYNIDDFENEKEDKFVYLEREFKMVCSYNYKFKKWVPLRVADEKIPLYTFLKKV